jgi:hypothetical protein
MKDVCSVENDYEYIKYVSTRPADTFLGRSRSECDRIAKDYYTGVGVLGRTPYFKSRSEPSCDCK